MKYPYIVNKNGTWYPAGTDVPEDADVVVEGESVGNVEGDVIEITGEEGIEDTSKEMENRDKTYTKTEINRMSTAELQELASNTGVEGASEMTGTELKKMLIERFGL